MIVIANKKSKAENLLKKYGQDAIIIDVTSKAQDDMVRLSPFYPHGGIPVPFSPGYTAMSVEGIWQGLKVFERVGIDVQMFRNATMKNLKRTVFPNSIKPQINFSIPNVSTSKRNKPRAGA